LLYQTEGIEMTAQEKFIEAIAAPAFAYCRARSWRASGAIMDDGDLIIYVYHRDNTSPTGVTCVSTCGGSVEDFADAVAAMDKRGIPFPLSPTEGLRKS
jgi:hypothetical protein